MEVALFSGGTVVVLLGATYLHVEAQRAASWASWLEDYYT